MNATGEPELYRGLKICSRNGAKNRIVRKKKPNARINRAKVHIQYLPQGALENTALRRAVSSGGKCGLPAAMKSGLTAGRKAGGNEKNPGKELCPALLKSASAPVMR